VHDAAHPLTKNTRFRDHGHGREPISVSCLFVDFSSISFEVEMAGMQFGGYSIWFGWCAGKGLVRQESAMISGINRIFIGQLEHVIDRKILLGGPFGFFVALPLALFKIWDYLLYIRKYRC